MTVLTEQLREALAARFMRENRDPVNATKDDVRALVDAIDDYIDSILPGFYAAAGAVPGFNPDQMKNIASLVVRQRFEG